jgi:hypothetical protein
MDCSMAQSIGSKARGEPSCAAAAAGGRPGPSTAGDHNLVKTHKILKMRSKRHLREFILLKTCSHTSNGTTGTNGLVAATIFTCNADNGSTGDEEFAACCRVGGKHRDRRPRGPRRNMTMHITMHSRLATRELEDGLKATNPDEVAGLVRELLVLQVGPEARSRRASSDTFKIICINMTSTNNNITMVARRKRKPEAH